LEVTDALTRALRELLIENATMKALLRGKVDDLSAILSAAKADPEKQRKAAELVAPLKTAISDEVAVERIMQRIAETSEGKNQS